MYGHAFTTKTCPVPLLLQAIFTRVLTRANAHVYPVILLLNTHEFNTHNAWINTVTRKLKQNVCVQSLHTCKLINEWYCMHLLKCFTEFLATQGTEYSNSNDCKAD